MKSPHALDPEISLCWYKTACTLFQNTQYNSNILSFLKTGPLCVLWSGSAEALLKISSKNREPLSSDPRSNLSFILFFLGCCFMSIFYQRFPKTQACLFSLILVCHLIGRCFPRDLSNTAGFLFRIFELFPKFCEHCFRLAALRLSRPFQWNRNAIFILFLFWNPRQMDFVTCFIPLKLLILNYSDFNV